MNISIYTYNRITDFNFVEQRQMVRQREGEAEMKQEDG